MNVVQWLSLAVIVVASVGLSWLIRGYRHEITDVIADLDEARDNIADLTADVHELTLLVQQTRTRLTQLANHVVATEQPSTGRHARAELEAAA